METPFSPIQCQVCYDSDIEHIKNQTVFRGNYNNNTLQHAVLTLLILFLSNQLLQLLSFLLHLSFSIFNFILEGQKNIHEWRASLKTAPKMIAQKEHIIIVLY